MTEPVLYPIDILIESTGGGTIRHVMDLFDALQARGRDVRLIVSTLRGDPSFLEWLSRVDPARVIQLNLRRGPHPSDLKALQQLRRALRCEGRERLLHAHSTKAGFIGALASDLYAGALFTPHAYRGMDPTLHPTQRCALRAIEYGISRLHDRIIAVSPEERDYALDIGLQAERLRYIPNGIDIATIAAAAGTRRPRTTAGPVIGFGSRIVYQKNPLTFVEVIARVRAERPDVRAVIVGAGDMDLEVDALIRRLGLEDAVTRLGHVGLVEHLHDMDVMVHTSRYESLPYALLEACAVGLPVVSVRNAGSKAIFGANSDLVADSQDAEGLAQRTLALLKSSEKMKASQARSFAAGQRFSIKAMVDSIEEVYVEVEGKSGVRSRKQASGSHLYAV